MKRTLSMIALAALTMGLLGSCSKINERLDNLEKEVSGIENEQIASINSQIDGIKTSIADLGTIRSDISSLKQSASDHSVDIFNLEEADRALKDRIVNLEDYVDAVLPNYAEKEWVEATFSTLEQYEATCDTIAKIDARIGALDAKLSKDIKATADSLTKWVNKTFEGYYTAAQMDAKLTQMKSDIDSAKAANKITDAKADSIATELTNAKAAVDTAKANIRAEYKAAVKSAIEESEGKLTKALNDAIATVNGTITALTGRVDALETSVAALTGRVDALEGMIQSVTIVPAYSDGSVEAINGIVELNLIVSPSSAVEGLTNEKVNILLNTVATKAVSVDTVEADKIKSFTVDKTKGTVEIKADISDKINALQSKQLLTIAVNVTNGDLSDFTTEFVGVTTVAFKAVYDTNNEANTLTFYYDAVDHSGEGTVYDNLPTAATGKTSWGYDGVRKEIKKVVITESVKNYSGLTSTAYMFQGMTAASDISGAEYLDVLNVTDMSWMFQNFGGGASGSPTTLNSVPDVSGWDTGNVTNMAGMFESYGNFSSKLDKVPDVSGWNTGMVTDMTFMFQKYGHESQNFNAVPDVSQWNTGYVTNMKQMFYEYGHKSTALNTVPNVSGWNTGNVTNMSGMFNGYGYTSTNISCVLDLSGWDLSNITGTNGGNVFNFNPKTFNVTIPAKTGERSNEGGKWYYGNGTNSITPPEGKTFTPLLPAGALKGEFSVSATKKVHFSQGNLWADGDKALHFEANQYSSASSWDASHVSHFTWSSTVAVAVGDIFRGDYLFCDESHKVSVDGGEAIYYALSKDEWTYLFNTRTMTNGKDRYSNAMSGVSIGGATYKGVFLYPDNYNGEVVSSSMSWNDINAAGIVFLPAAGYRFQSSLDFVGDSDYYWSSTAYDEYEAYYVYFGSGDLPDHDDRDYGFSVRLVTEVPAAGSTIEDFNKKNDDPGNWN